MEDLVLTVAMKDTGDDRGSSYPLDKEVTEFLGEARGCHLATILPEKIRGNHYHLVQREILFIEAGTPWILHWDNGEGTPVQRRHFAGTQAVLVKIRPGASHAVENNGATALRLVGLTDRFYDAAGPDAHRRLVSRDLAPADGD